MKYTEFTIAVPDGEASEIAVACLSDLPFDSFSEEDGILKAYIPTAEADNFREDISDILNGLGYRAKITELEDRNWNAVWESGFDPVNVEGRCLIRAPFHPDDESFEYRIEIMPKMSFGTGHHATTCLMAAEIMDNEFTELTGLDMGSGTGILAILAAMRGAAHTDAVDIDRWAYENSMENIKANGVADKVTPIIGDVSVLKGKVYDFILANINRNILLADMPVYEKKLAPGGFLIVSGILEADVPAIKEKAASLGLRHETLRLREGWAALKFHKKQNGTQKLH